MNKQKNFTGRKLIDFSGNKHKHKQYELLFLQFRNHERIPALSLYVIYPQESFYSVERKSGAAGRGSDGWTTSPEPLSAISSI